MDEMKKSRLVIGIIVTTLLMLGITLPAVAQMQPPEPGAYPREVTAEMSPGSNMLIPKVVKLPEKPAGADNFTDVWWEVSEASPELTVRLINPDAYYDVAWNSTVDFREIISVAPNATHCTNLTAVVIFYADSMEDGAAVAVGKQEISIHVNDEAPFVRCIECENPHGKNVPPAGWSTLPGPKGGKNDDGFYMLIAQGIQPDANGEELINVGYAGGEGDVLARVPSETRIKFTEAPGAAPSCKKMGSSKGQAGAVKLHITAPSEPILWIIGIDGNVRICGCQVPPPPK